MTSSADETARHVAFAGERRIAAGTLAEAALAAQRALAAEPTASVLVFAAASGRVVDLDLRGGAEDLLARLAEDQAEPEPPRRGRPKLGVVAREVTLLPRHWDWLATQPGGASAALRRLVEAARRGTASADRIRMAREAAYRFMATMGGDRPGFEAASRALFAGDADGLAARIADWPADIRDEIPRLLDPPAA